MPRVMIDCPAGKEPVFTGLEVLVRVWEMGVIIDQISVRCPGCEQTHEWTRKTAWLEMAKQ